MHIDDLTHLTHSRGGRSSKTTNRSNETSHVGTLARWMHGIKFPGRAVGKDRAPSGPASRGTPGVGELCSAIRRPVAPRRARDCGSLTNCEIPSSAARRASDRSSSSWREAACGRNGRYASRLHPKRGQELERADQHLRSDGRGLQRDGADPQGSAGRRGTRCRSRSTGRRSCRRRLR